MTSDRVRRPSLREDQPAYRVRPAASPNRPRASAPASAELRRLVRRRAAALIELEKN